MKQMEEEGISDLTSVLPELYVGVETEREPDGGRVIGPLLDFPLPLFDWGQAERARTEPRGQSVAGADETRRNQIRSTAGIRTIRAE